MDNSERNAQLREEISKLTDEKDSLLGGIAGLNEKVERLKTALKSINKEYDLFHAQRDSLKFQETDLSRWMGKNEENVSISKESLMSDVDGLVAKIISTVQTIEEEIEKLKKEIASDKKSLANVEASISSKRSQIK